MQWLQLLANPRLKAWVGEIKTTKNKNQGMGPGGMAMQFDSLENFFNETLNSLL